jgi:hypothetical protein
MRQKLIKSLKIGCIFIAGIFVGVTLMSLLDMYVRPMYRELIRIDLETEQEYLASRAARQGDKLRALSHRWNVVDTASESGFRAFRREQNKDIDASFFFPFQALILKTIVAPTEESQRRPKLWLEGMARGKLALALEAIDAKGEADKQWELALKLLKRQSVADVRQLILRFQAQENSDLYRQAEKAVLGDNGDKAQQ